MSMRGNCSCKNIELIWHVIDYSQVPRACQCDYCVARSAVYTCKSGTMFEVVIRKRSLHRCVRQGSNSAEFHECSNCGQMVFVAAEIHGQLYGALNANCLDNPLGFSPAVLVNFSDQTVAQKQQRWQQNWCHPIRITYLAE